MPYFLNLFQWFGLIRLSAFYHLVAQTWTAAKNSCDGMATTANIQIFYSLAGSTLAPQAVITAARLSYSTTTYARARINKMSSVSFRAADTSTARVNVHDTHNISDFFFLF